MVWAHVTIGMCVIGTADNQGRQLGRCGDGSYNTNQLNGLKVSIVFSIPL